MVAAEVDVIEQVDQRRGHLVLDHMAASHTPMPVMAMVGGQNRRVAATTAAATPTASTLPACMTTQNAGNRAVGRSLTSRNRSSSSTPTSSGRTVAMQPRRMASPACQPEHVAGVAQQESDLAHHQAGPAHEPDPGGQVERDPAVGVVLDRLAQGVLVTKPRARLTSPSGRACSSLRKSSR